MTLFNEKYTMTYDGLALHGLVRVDRLGSALNSGGMSEMNEEGITKK